MKKLLLLLLISILFLVACSNSNPDSLQSWAYSLVTWNNDVYKMTDEVITEVDSKIGTIKNTLRMKVMIYRIYPFSPRGLPLL